MSFVSRKKKHSKAPSTSVPASGLASSQVTQQLQFPTNSQPQPHLQSPQEKQQSQHVYPWSAHAPSFGQSPSPFPLDGHSLTMRAIAGAGELFLFGGYVQRSRSASNDLYVISTRDFSIALLQTSGNAPSPRYGHRAVLTTNTLLIWGGVTDFSNRNERKASDDSLYLLNLGT
jgi:hypothetical protein